MMSNKVRGILAAVLAFVLMVAGFAAFKTSVKAEEVGEALGAVDQVLEDQKAELEEEVEQAAENGEQQSSIHYDGPKEAFEKANGIFLNVASLIKKAYSAIKDKLGTGAFIGALALTAALIVLFFISMAIMFKKAGVPAWLAFIPFVDVYYCFKIGWEKEKTWTLLLAVVAIYLGTFLGGIKELPIGAAGWNVPGFFGTIFGLVTIIGWGLLIVFTLRLAQGIAEGFGLHFSFGIGLWLLPIIFLPILAFCPTKYVYRLGSGQVKVD